MEPDQVRVLVQDDVDGSRRIKTNESVPAAPARLAVFYDLCVPDNAECLEIKLKLLGAHLKRETMNEKTIREVFDLLLREAARVRMCGCRRWHELIG